MNCSKTLLRHSRFLPTAGFTLLEVTVALALLSAVGIASYSLMYNSLVSMNRVQEKHGEIHVSYNALAFMHTINPTQNPSGEAQLGDYTILWDAVPAMEPVIGSKRLFGKSLYELTLYNTNVKILLEGQKFTTMDLILVGYFQIAPYEMPFM